MRAFDIPDDWTDEDALVVFEFIDEIRDQIWGHYGLQIQSAARLTRRVGLSIQGLNHDNGQIDLFDDDTPF